MLPPESMLNLCNYSSTYICFFINKRKKERKKEGKRKGKKIKEIKADNSWRGGEVHTMQIC